MKFILSLSAMFICCVSFVQTSSATENDCSNLVAFNPRLVDLNLINASKGDRVLLPNANRYRLGVFSNGKFALIRHLLASVHDNVAAGWMLVDLASGEKTSLPDIEAFPGASELVRLSGELIDPNAIKTVQEGVNQYYSGYDYFTTPSNSKGFTQTVVISDENSTITIVQRANAGPYKDFGENFPEIDLSKAITLQIVSVFGLDGKLLAQSSLKDSWVKQGSPTEFLGTIYDSSGKVDIDQLVASLGPNKPLSAINNKVHIEHVQPFGPRTWQFDNHNRVIEYSATSGTDGVLSVFDDRHNLLTTVTGVQIYDDFALTGPNSILLFAHQTLAASREEQAPQRPLVLRRF